MDVVIIIFIIFIVAMFVGMITLITNLERNIKYIKDKLVDKIPEKMYDEYCVKPLNKYTTFRVVPFTNSLGENVWNVEYRNPADTTWKVCRCEKSQQKAYNQVQDIIKRIKEGEI